MNSDHASEDDLLKFMFQIKKIIITDSIVSQTKFGWEKIHLEDWLLKKIDNSYGEQKDFEV